MYSRQDQLQAHRFALRRIRSALTLGEPDAPEAPLSRSAAALVAGVVIAALVLAGEFVFGKVKTANCASDPRPACVAPAQK